MSIEKCRTTHSGEVLSEDFCPVCSYKVDAATPLPGQGDCRPKAGDLSLCLKCGELLEYSSSLRLAQASLDSVQALDESTKAQIAHAQNVIRKERLIK
jgi:hypothetical protein